MSESPSEILAQLGKGRPPHTSLDGSMAMLFSNYAATHELRAWAEQDSFRYALTGDRDIDLWRAWREARILQANFDLNGAYRHLSGTAALHPPSADNGRLVEVERLLLVTRVTAMLNDVPQALQLTI